MKQYNLNDKEDFRELEVLAYNCAVPLERLSGAAYKYFAELEKASRLYKQGNMTQQELQAKRQRLLVEYTADISEHKRNTEGIREYQRNIKAAGSYLTAIEKAKTASDIAEYAVHCIEAMTGETGFAARQISKLKGDITANDQRRTSLLQKHQERA